MLEYKSNVTLNTAAARIRSADRVVIITHAKPDGDAFGCVAALTQAIRLAGKEAVGVLVPPVPVIFGSLLCGRIAKKFDPTVGLPEGDLLIILDTGAWAQVSPLRPFIEPRLPNTLLIDHHLTGDIPAAARYIDTTSGSCCEIVAELIDELATVLNQRSKQTGVNKLIDATVAESIYIGIVSDTGWFRYSNTRPQTHDLAARLLRLGVNNTELFTVLEQSQRPEKLALMQRGLASMRMLANNRAALIVLRAEDFAETGAGAEETEGIVDIPRSVAGVEVVAVVSQPPMGDGLRSGVSGVASAGADEPVRISFRSKSGPDAVDVAKFAQQFGGGGHARAAGAKLVNTPIDDVVARVAAALPGLLTGTP